MALDILDELAMESNFSRAIEFIKSNYLINGEYFNIISADILLGLLKEIRFQNYMPSNEELMIHKKVANDSFDIIKKFLTRSRDYLSNNEEQKMILEEFPNKYFLKEYYGKYLYEIAIYFLDNHKEYIASSLMKNATIYGVSEAENLLQ